ncbi:CPCC family cysteine-rich protein [Amycolatopsis speibonae]|uniref:CPCC family cysteine-rich protein n=1 Tax=Amycolatopsis speibonae TaxID=1450224 RepID=A0ABV7P6R4_9PSEU
MRGPGDDPTLSEAELIGRRTAWFKVYTRQRNVFAPTGGGPCTCPCCGHTTLSERGRYEICEECGWEDDGQDDHVSAAVRGGPNGRLSLDASRSTTFTETDARSAA